MKAILVYFFFLSSFLEAFPINFYRNQGDLHYDELVNDHFYFYHDSEAPGEGVFLFNSLESAVPKLSRWFGVSDKDTMIGISSTKTSHASFANFFFNTIELQTLGRGGRDLAWHELTHMFMYKKYDYPFLSPFFGHASPIVHLFWMPVWFIEGLAELTSRSSGSAKMASVERYQALSGDWPPYDDLHSLYDGGGFAARGYATSGAFLTWMFMKKEENVIPRVLDNIRHYSMPWYYLWRLNPFSSFLPVDHSLEKEFKKKGRELYEDYKRESREFWLSQKEGPFFAGEAVAKFSLNIYRPLLLAKNHSFVVVSTEDKIRRHKLVFDKNTGWLVGIRPYGPEFRTWFNAKGLITSSNKTFVVQYDRDLKYGNTTHKLVRLSEKGKMNELKKDRVLYKPKGFIDALFESRTQVLWLEKEKEITRLCSYDKNDFFQMDEIQEEKKNCFLEKRFPESIEILGALKRSDDPSGEELESLFYKVSEEKLKGKREEIFQLNPETRKTLTIPYSRGGSVRTIRPFEGAYLFLVETLSKQKLLHMSKEGLCLGEYGLSDYLLDFHSFPDNSLLLSLYRGKYKSLRKVKIRELKKMSCSYYKDHDSPLLFANRSEASLPELSEALKGSSYWETDRVQKDIHLSEEEKVLTEEDDLDLKIFKTKASVKKSHFRARSVFYLPIFLNPNHITEPGIGLFSIPFMDHMQNHQVWASAFWDFRNPPAVSLEYRLTRFWPTMHFEFYRREFWNGFELQSATREGEKDKILLSYVSEIGGLFTINFKWYTRKTITSLTGFLRAAYRQDETKVSKTDKTIVGGIYRPSLQLSHLIHFDHLALAFGGRFSYTLPVLGSNFDYYTLGGDVTLSKPFDFLDSTLIAGLSMDFTRGKAGKLPLLRQYYSSLKTYIPSGTSEFSDSNYRLFGTRKLFSLRYGDDKARVSVKWKWPILKEMNKLFWVFFLKRLNFTALVNYGGIWPKGKFDYKRLSLSHAYNLDLHFGNKGVNLYSGVGVGQYFGMEKGYMEPSVPAVFFRFGFQALF